MNTRNNNFALLHYVAASMVILGHMVAFCGSVPPIILNVSTHETGLHILFIISGFLVARSFSRNPNVLKFWAKRLLRLYPALCVCVVVCAIGGFLLSGLTWAEYFPGAKVYIKNNLLMRPVFYLPGVFAENPYSNAVNGSLWSLPVELAWFLIIPVFLMPVHKTKHKAIFCALAAGLVSLLAVFVSTHYAGKQLIFWATDWIHAIRLGAYFLWGSAYSLLEQDQLKKLCRSDVAVLLLAIALSLGSYYPPALNYFLLPYVIISFAFAGDGLFRDFLNRHDYVYGMYLWAFPVQQTIISLFRGGNLPPVWIMFAVCYAITLLLSMLNHKFIDEPVRKIAARSGL